MDMRLTRWNRKAEAVTGFSFDELCRRPATDFFPPEERSTIQRNILDAFAKGYAEVEGYLCRKDGSRVPYHWTAVPLKHGDGTVIGLTGVGRNPEIVDACRGSGAALGVGIMSMRERIRQLGGQLEIQSVARGTTVTAVLPFGRVPS